MKKKLIIKQDGFKDCGAACLLSIIRYYGGDIAKERLIELVKTTKDGTSFYNISLAASHLGFAAKGFKVDEIDKIKEVNLPFISQVNKNGYMHFVVVYKINNNKILIMNPSTGKEVIDIFDFSNMWTGYILLLEKVSELPVYKSNKIIKKIIFKVLNDNKSNIIIVFILSVIFTLLSCIVGLYSQIVFDKVIDTELHNLKLITIVFFILYIIKNITSFIRNHLLIYLNQKLDVTLLIESFCKVILLPFNYYKNKKASEVLSRINDLSYIKSFISKIIVTILLDILLFIISFIIIFNINKDILILYLVGTFLYFLIIIIYNTIIKNTIITKQERVVEVNNTIIESVNGFETIKGLNIEDNIIYKFSKNYSKLLNINYYTDKINNTILLLKEFITDSIILLVSYYTFSLIMNSKVTVGDYMTISFLSSYLIYPFRNIIDLIYEYYYVKNSIRRANDFFDIEDEKIYEDKRLEVNGNIKIVNLSYTFNNKYYVLKNINLFIKDKDRVLLLGSSGSGKSTILKLLYKYLQADRNKIFINNYDINDYSMSDIRSSITYVSQNELLFNDTIRNNILLDRDVREVDYLNICKILHIDDIVKDNILGYDYILEENGINISGGQRQRIILARSLLKNSKIIMIDEGFNQIDIKLEREILLDIFRYFHDRTFIIISHRIENSDLYNRIIKINNGEVNMIEEVYNE